MRAIEVTRLRPTGLINDDPWDGIRERMLISSARVQAMAVRLFQTRQPRFIEFRIRYMHKKDFPRAYGTMRGGRTNVSLQDALKIMIALSLLQTGGAFVVAMDSIRQSWDEIERGLITAWVDRHASGAAWTLVVTSNILDGDDNLVFQTFNASAEGATVRDILRRKPVTLIDLSGIMSRLEEIVLAENVATADELHGEMRLLAADAFGSADPREWTIAKA